MLEVLGILALIAFLMWVSPKCPEASGYIKCHWWDVEHDGCYSRRECRECGEVEYYMEGGEANIRLRDPPGKWKLTRGEKEL